MDCILEVKNKHSEDCGTPPRINSDNCSYISYFENEHGEQWILFRNKGSTEVFLRGGDCGWDRVVHVVGNEVPKEIVLSADEKTWVFSCLLALGRIKVPSFLK